MFIGLRYFTSISFYFTKKIVAYRGHLILVGYLPIFFIILICENIFFSQLKGDNFDTFLIHIVIVSGNEILWSLKITLKQFLENYNKTRDGEIVKKILKHKEYVKDNLIYN